MKQPVPEKVALKDAKQFTRIGKRKPGVPPLAPAFANAIAALTAKPLRDLPFKLV